MIIDVRDLDRAARLARVAEGPVRDGGDRARKVAIAKNDGRIFSAHLDARRDAPFGALQCHLAPRPR